MNRDQIFQMLYSLDDKDANLAISILGDKEFVVSEEEFSKLYTLRSNQKWLYSIMYPHGPKIILRVKYNDSVGTIRIMYRIINE